MNSHNKLKSEIKRHNNEINNIINNSKIPRIKELVNENRHIKKDIINRRKIFRKNFML